MTFQPMFTAPAMKNSTAITGTDVVIAGASPNSGKLAVARRTVHLSPSRLRKGSTRKDPITEPAPRVVMRRPNPASSRPSGPGSMAYKGKMAKTAVDARLEIPTQMASKRSRRWRAR